STVLPCRDDGPRRRAPGHVRGPAAAASAVPTPAMLLRKSGQVRRTVRGSRAPASDRSGPRLGERRREFTERELGHASTAREGATPPPGQRPERGRPAASGRGPGARTVPVHERLDTLELRGDEGRGGRVRRFGQGSGRSSLRAGPGPGR